MCDQHSGAGRCALRLEALEDRLALSWAGVPPTLITPPTNAVAVTLNSQAAASGSAGITSTEVDYFSFTASRSGSYRIAAATPSSNLDPVLGVFSASGQRLAYNDDISSTNTDSQLSLNLTAGNRYFIGVTNYTGTVGGAYSWSIAGPALAEDRYEDNDSFSQAANLGTLTGRTTLTNLALADSADWFRFTMTGAGNANSYAAINFTHAQGDLDLRLYDSTGTLRLLSDGTSNQERVSLNGLAAGTYYVQVYGYRGATNPMYSLDITPGAGTPSGGNRVLYLNFDGASISRADLVRWAGSDWAGSLNSLDSDRNGIQVTRFLNGRADREQVIARVMQLVQEDLRPFGITVRRHTGLAVENQGATTIFLGRSTLTGGNVHVACEVDIGNNNRTDIAFVGDEYWGTTERTAIAMADVTLHEAGHTYGLWHVNSGTQPESMGLRYSIRDSSQWVVNTSFLDRTFVEYVDPQGLRHGPGPQNSYRSMLQHFGLAGAPSASAAVIDFSRGSTFSITTSDRAADDVRLRRLASGAIEVSINGQVFELARGHREVVVNTGGDRRDRVLAMNDLGDVRLVVRDAALMDQKIDVRQGSWWAGNRFAEAHNAACNCAACAGAAAVSLQAEAPEMAVFARPMAGMEWFAPRRTAMEAPIALPVAARQDVADAILTAWRQTDGRPRGPARPPLMDDGWWWN